MFKKLDRHIQHYQPLFVRARRQRRPPGLIQSWYGRYAHAGKRSCRRRAVSAGARWPECEKMSDAAPLDRHHCGRSLGAFLHSRAGQASRPHPGFKLDNVCRTPGNSMRGPDVVYLAAAIHLLPGRVCTAFGGGNTGKEEVVTGPVGAIGKRSAVRAYIW